MNIDTLLKNMSPDTAELNRSILTGKAGHGSNVGKNKYHAQKETVNEHVFDSKKEATRYRKLSWLEQSGYISNLKLQPVFELQPAFTDATGKRHRAITYRADFQYTENGREIIEDTKGMETAVFKLKKKLFLFKYQLDLRIT